MPNCSVDGCTRTAWARGICQVHYNRLRRSGTVERKNAINTGVCAEPGCGKTAFAKNLCSVHYQRAQHPLRTIWRLLRSRAGSAYPGTWDRFDAFLADVGERPTDKHQLRRPDPSKPWSASNFVWREPIGVGPGADYAQAWDRRKKYGLTNEDVEAMRQRQDNRCAVCTTEFSTGVKMCIDHDHKTGAVRGLLCDPCNKVLGFAGDDPGLLRAAISYLEHHAYLELIAQTGSAPLDGA